ncbi:DUF1642 domain-containing protein [Listeria monocytogenes]|uniref:DUF1642 domain-containing protein n=1 Tax=Listeria monocytogenes TaxID=1639 RepID=UPI000D0AEBB7|nr:DUF1642 domain-containing protein [Listeria monocytogenes]EAF4475968.1 DUF1642 domain-containing protein [Listeria monocytogenes serotype 4b]EAC3774020.1 DUF1642 domain-containing protein [Listeria monocytogenes]EAC6525898.1 DUF1642 domain-containing protein [Listeria monocytogenes]EAC7654659.1 DUF1642 domain-containing protein [Listeria monocytogenes]EAD3066925.1 DUF1642 domain-containing protein [Listeria monocytogenes]
MKFKKGENVHVIAGNELLNGWYNGKEFGTGNSLVKVSKDKIIATKDCFIAKEKEAELVVVPQCVADWIEQKKANGDQLYIAMDKSWESMNYTVSDWLEEGEDRYNKFARAWLDGYEVEKEPVWVVENENGYRLRSITMNPGNSLNWSFDSKNKNYIEFEEFETAKKAAYLVTGNVTEI